jgi:hypothetical protein
MLIGAQPDLGVAVRGPHPRPADLDSAATERDLPALVAMAYSRAIRVVLALRADDVIDLLLHQLGQHPEPDTDAQREQALLRSADQLAQRLLHALGKHGFIRGRLSDRYGLLHGGSSFDLCRITANAPSRSGHGGGTAVTSKFYEPRDNLASWGTRAQASRNDKRGRRLLTLRRGRLRVSRGRPGRT